ncbi:MAG: N-6 DNA methylase, partial [Nitrososphaeraceae archaeon]
MTGTNLPKSLEFVVDDMIQVLRNTDLPRIVKQLHVEKWTDDPVIHFYETFLKVYDPEIRNSRGVFYTPMPVVLYIVRSLHDILKTKFSVIEGLASKNVTLLDPAAGTMTFTQ